MAMAMTTACPYNVIVKPLEILTEHSSYVLLNILATLDLQRMYMGSTNNVWDLNSISTEATYSMPRKEPILWTSKVFVRWSMSLLQSLYQSSFSVKALLYKLLTQKREKIMVYNLTAIMMQGLLGCQKQVWGTFLSHNRVELADTNINKTVLCSWYAKYFYDRWNTHNRQQLQHQELDRIQNKIEKVNCWPKQTNKQNNNNNNSASQSQSINQNWNQNCSTPWTHSCSHVGNTHWYKDCWVVQTFLV